MADSAVVFPVPASLLSAYSNSTVETVADPVHTSTLAVKLFTLAAIIAAALYAYIASERKLPHGPWGYPILGSFSSYPSSHKPTDLSLQGSFPMLTHYPELTLDKWARKYGDFYSVRLGSQLFAIVSDPGVAKDLMITQGAVFSDRKEMYIKSQTVFAGRGITATPYNDRWCVVLPSNLPSSQK